MQVIPVDINILSPLSAQMGEVESLLLDYPWPDLPAIPEGFDTSEPVGFTALEELKAADLAVTRGPSSHRSVRFRPPRPDEANQNSLGSATPAEALQESLENFLYAFQVSNPVLLGTSRGPCFHLPGKLGEGCWQGWQTLATTPSYVLELTHSMADDLGFFRWDQDSELRTNYLREGWNARVIRLGDENNRSWFCYYSQTPQTVLRIDLGDVSPQFLQSFLASR